MLNPSYNLKNAIIKLKYPGTMIRKEKVSGFNLKYLYLKNGIPYRQTFVNKKLVENVGWDLTKEDILNNQWIVLQQEIIS